jgi:hypothetical protein
LNSTCTPNSQSVPAAECHVCEGSGRTSGEPITLEGVRVLLAAVERRGSA